MLQVTYVINSPEYPVRKDFRLFPVWCQWEEYEEVPFLKSLCDSEKEFEEVILSEYKKGKETYYPIPNHTTLPDHRYFLIKAEILINDQFSVKGYLTTSNEEVVSMTLWPKHTEPDFSVYLFKSDRMLAHENHAASMSVLSSLLGTGEINLIQYSTAFYFCTGQKVEGTFNCMYP